MVFAGQGRDQYLVEGIFVALLALGNGLALCLMVAATRIKRFPLFRHALVTTCLSCYPYRGDGAALSSVAVGLCV